MRENTHTYVPPISFMFKMNLLNCAALISNPVVGLMSLMPWPHNNVRMVVLPAPAATQCTLTQRLHYLLWPYITALCISSLQFSWNWTVLLKSHKLAHALLHSILVLHNVLSHGFIAGLTHSYGSYLLNRYTQATSLVAGEVVSCKIISETTERQCFHLSSRKLTEKLL